MQIWQIVLALVLGLCGCAVVVAAARLHARTGQVRWLHAGGALAAPLVAAMHTVLLVNAAAL